jgi:o-succinylbenzoate---CoA ligase
MQDWLSARAQATPDALALITEDRITFGWFNDHVAHLCATLVKSGVQSGQIVAVLAKNDVTYVALIFALHRLNAILLPLNLRLTPAELTFQLDQTDCSLVICTSDTVSLAAQLAASARHIFIHATHSPDPHVQPLHFDSRNADYQTGTIQLENPAAIVFTSGTSGTPKGAVLTAGNFFYSAMSSAYHLGTLPDDRWLCVLPLFHVGGLSMIYRACLHGVPVILHERFDAEKVNHTLTHEPVSLVSLVPTMLYRLLEIKQGAWHPQLRCVLLGGAATPPELVARCAEQNIPIATTYGLTEAASQVATSPLMASTKVPLPAKRGGARGGDKETLEGHYVGRPLLFTSVRIVDDSGQSLPPNTPGEIAVRGLTVMQSYYARPEATAKTLRDSELFTGDMGYLDTEGNLYLLQRRSDLILSGGENVYPAEVESVLKQHPAVQDACVVGVPHPEWGQQVAAAIVLKPATLLTDDELLAFTREKLARYKQPRRILFVDALPMTGSGKIQRAAVQAMFEGNGGR